MNLFVDWETASPESQNLDSAKLTALWRNLAARNTTGLLVIRADKIVFERYAEGWNRTKRHGTASLAKALVGSLSLQVAQSDGRIAPDDPACRFIPEWSGDDRKKRITIRHLATHTSGIEDAEEGDTPHERLTGWKGDFWKRLPVPRDPFTLSRDVAPVLFTPGTHEAYSNPGMAMLAYCVTASLRGTPFPDLRALLQNRLLAPLGIPADEWTCGYDGPIFVNGLPLISNWGGASSSANATARLGRLMLKNGVWNGRPLIAPSVVRQAVTYAGMPNASGLGWWVNRTPTGGRRWKALPDDAFWGSGAGHKFLLVVPSLDLIVVRNGQTLDDKGEYNSAIELHIVNPLLQAFLSP